MEFYNIEKGPEKALLMSVDTGDFDAESSINELSLLAESAGADVVGEIIQKREAPDSATYVGAGKIAEAELFCSNADVDLIICDSELTPSQIRNIEKRIGVRVIDRTQLILDIFALRAKSREGALQVELAQLKYSLPRLTGRGTEMSRLGGGIGTRGPGESKLESDRRHIMRRIKALSEKLSEIDRRREFLRKRREKDRVTTVALVGYTNAGKSTLMNALTNAGVLSEDKLFATLDPTSRRLTLPDGRNVMLIDTVGFVSRLPHDLVNAFKSTLEEAALADIILNICDASDPHCTQQVEVTVNILKELGQTGDNIITVLNKCDKAENVFGLLPFTKTVMISALNGTNISTLLDAISEMLAEKTVTLKMLIPFSCGSDLNEIRKCGKILSEKYTEIGTQIEASVPVSAAEMYKGYII